MSGYIQSIDMYCTVKNAVIGFHAELPLHVKLIIPKCIVALLCNSTFFQLLQNLNISPVRQQHLQAGHKLTARFEL